MLMFAKMIINPAVWTNYFMNGRPGKGNVRYKTCGKRGAEMHAMVKKSRSRYSRVKLQKRIPTPIAEIEKFLGIDKADPIVLTSSEAGDNFDKDREYFKDMYENELRELYKKIYFTTG